MALRRMRYTKIDRHIRKHNNKWQVQVRRKGYRSFTKSFSYRKDAETWARAKERKLDYIFGNIIGSYEDAPIHITHIG